jgi:hypothetical protein
LTTLRVFDVLGREVAVLFHDIAVPGQSYTKEFNASRLSSGVYFSVVQSVSERKTTKMLLVK